LRESVSALGSATLVSPAFLSIDSKPGYQGEKELEAQAPCQPVDHSVLEQLHAQPQQLHTMVALQPLFRSLVLMESARLGKLAKCRDKADKTAREKNLEALLWITRM
jgi:hypothetical protein